MWILYQSVAINCRLEIIGSTRSLCCINVSLHLFFKGDAWNLEAQCVAFQKIEMIERGIFAYQLITIVIE